MKSKCVSGECVYQAAQKAGFFLLLLLFVAMVPLSASEILQSSIRPKALYQQLRAFQLSGESVHAEHLQLKRDRLVLDWSGDFYLEAPIEGRVYGAVFIGKGHIVVEPSNPFERDSLQRFLQSKKVEDDFKEAVLRFTDDTPAFLSGLPRGSSGELAKAQRSSAELEERLTTDTGLNLSERLLSAVLNGDEPGVFFAQFSSVTYGRFAALLDHQTRAVATVFGIDGGEKGLLFQKRGDPEGTDVWTAFYDEEDFKNGKVFYANHFDLVDTPDYRMEIDLREAGHWLRSQMEIDVVALRDGIQVIPMALNEELDPHGKERAKKGVKVTSASLADGSAVGVIQEPSESGVSLVMPYALKKGDKVTVKLTTEAEHGCFDWEDAFHFPLSTTSWYPRHGFLRRSRFQLTFLHKQKTKVISAGELFREGPDQTGKDMVTEWITPMPISFDSFAVGPFERHNGNVKLGERTVPLEFYSAPARYAAIKEDFVLAEMGNGLKFFSNLFGPYPYDHLGASYFPSSFGQGFPTMLLLPSEGRSSLSDFAFIAHEVSHEWWGDFVGWQSYRDQWLSEGFAQYSAALYASSRDNPKKALDLVKEMRRLLQFPPVSDTGVGPGKVNDVGPLIMGHRLSSRLSRSSYFILIYEKGALVLRMLHFLFTDPSSGNDEAFYRMMRDFVRANQGGAPSTERFFAQASERFAETPIARKYGLKDLNWFLRQWVYQSPIPSYRLEYDLKPRAEGGVFLEGTIYQDGVPADWFMPLPLTFDFGENKQAQALVYANGAQTQMRVCPDRDA